MTHAWWSSGHHHQTSGPGSVPRIGGPILPKRHTSRSKSVPNRSNRGIGYAVWGPARPNNNGTTATHFRPDSRSHQLRAALYGPYPASCGETGPQQVVLLASIGRSCVWSPPNRPAATNTPPSSTTIDTFSRTILDRSNGHPKHTGLLEPQRRPAAGAASPWASLISIRLRLRLPITAAGRAPPPAAAQQRQQRRDPGAAQQEEEEDEEGKGGGGGAGG